MALSYPDSTNTLAHDVMRAVMDAHTEGELGQPFKGLIEAMLTRFGSNVFTDHEPGAASPFSEVYGAFTGNSIPDWAKMLEIVLVKQFGGLDNEVPISDKGYMDARSQFWQSQQFMAMEPMSGTGAMPDKDHEVFDKMLGAEFRSPAHPHSVLVRAVKEEIMSVRLWILPIHLLVYAQIESPEAPTPVAVRSESDRVCTAIKTALSEQREALKAAFATAHPGVDFDTLDIGNYPPEHKMAVLAKKTMASQLALLEGREAELVALEAELTDLNLRVANQLDTADPTTRSGVQNRLQFQMEHTQKMASIKLQVLRLKTKVSGPMAIMRRIGNKMVQLSGRLMAILTDRSPVNTGGATGCWTVL